MADIVIFDAEKVTEHADYKVGKNGLASTGIPHVLVNGTVVMKDSKVLKGVTPGQSIRFPVEKKGRFVPATKEMWLKSHTIDSGGVAPREGKTSFVPKPVETKALAQLFNPLNYVSLDCCENPYAKRHTPAPAMMPAQLRRVPLIPVSTDPYDPLSVAALRAGR